jgi:RNase P/RNase MRP subunit POP5
MEEGVEGGFIKIPWKSLFTTSTIQKYMPSKIKTDRKRYIAFKITAPRVISRKELISTIREKVKSNESWGKMKPWLTIFEDNEGILRCVHTNKDEAVKLLTSIKIVGKEKMPVRVETLGTSGTIKQAKRKYLNLRN